MRSVKIRVFALLLCLMTLFSLLPCGEAFAAEGEEEEVLILAASDFQPQGGVIQGKKILNGIAEAMAADGLTSFDALFYCGDYTNSMGSVSATQDGLGGIKEVYGKLVSKRNSYFVQGNHDIMGGTNGLTPGGNNDPEGGAFGLYVINNDDYMWYNTDQYTVRHTAQRLIDYLNAKLEMGYDRPVFVLSHLPLHYSMRTRLEGDGKWAYFLFDALNDAAAKGLNIVYLFGHDHSNGWDDYLGGGSVFLKKGDTIQIAKAGSTTTIQRQELNFTYVNAGYTGYYDNSNGSDGALTSTVIRIKGDEITFTRYDQKGVHHMKSAGVRNEIKGETAYDPDTTVYPSPQTVKLTAVKTGGSIKDLEQTPRQGAAYVRVTTPIVEMQKGGRYLMVYTPGADKLVLPEVTVGSDSKGKSKGLKAEESTLFGDPVVCGDFEGYLFDFEKSGGMNWKIKKDGKYLLLKEDGELGVTATFEDEGSVFSFGYTTGGVTLKSKDGYYLCYNDRGLICGSKESSSPFYLYGAAGYAVDVVNGIAESGNPLLAAEQGKTVTLKADPFFAGFEFLRWEVLAGGVTPEDVNAPTTTFEMGGSSVKVKAVYGVHTHAYDGRVEDEQYLKEEGVYYLSCACGKSSKGTDVEQTFTAGDEEFSELPSESLPEDEKKEQDGGVLLIVGICLGSVAVVALIAVAIVVVMKKKKKK